MAKFSSDQTGQGAPGASRSQHPARFSPGAGNVGAQAAAHALKGGGGRGQASSRKAASGQGPSQQQFGHPDFGQGQDSESPSDFRHVDLVGQHFNMQGLGRDVPYAVWAYLTGNYRQLAQKGHPAFDILEDAG